MFFKCRENALIDLDVEQVLSQCKEECWKNGEGKVCTSALHV